MPKFKDISGEVFGRLTAVSMANPRLNPKGQSRTHWLCVCSCGTYKEVSQGNLTSGQVTSCGCRRREALDKTTHGMAGSDYYSVWANMLRRCNDPRDSHYHLYGERGIGVCREWLDINNFISDMGIRPPGMSIDRIDNDKGYCPENCRWATDVEQANNKRNSRRVTFRGITMTISEWARELGINHCTLHSRLEKMSVEDAMTRPVGPSPHRRRPLADHVIELEG